MVETNTFIEPTWKRIGLAEPPDLNQSGKGIGIIVLDDIIPHKQIEHLGERIIKVSVDDSFNVTCTQVALENHQQGNRESAHGMMVMQLLSHLPFSIHNTTHVGLVPAATFIVLSEVEPEKIKRGLEWIVQRRTNWNIRIVLNLLVPDTTMIGSMRDTLSDPYVKAFEPALNHGLLIVAANGNSKAHNNLHPISFFTVGGYDDQGLSDSTKHKPHPSVPWGRNGDGHMRPDILAPFTYLSTPNYENSAPCISYFGGSCGAAALVAGACAFLLSQYPMVDNETLMSALIYYGDRINNYDNPSPRMNVGKVIEAFEKDVTIPKRPDYSAPLIVNKPEQSLSSSDPIERAIALTIMIDHKMLARNTLWDYLRDDSPIVRKTIISYGLRAPVDEMERRLYWTHFYESAHESGEKISWLYQLLSNSTEDELAQWIELLREKDIESIHCVKLFIHKHCKSAPIFESSPDPAPEYIEQDGMRLMNWYKEYKYIHESN